MELAAPCDIDDARCYGDGATYFYRDDNAPRCDPIVRRRIRSLVNSCTALRSELHRRALIQSRDEPPPEKARSHADLIRHTFSEGVAA
jgi:hypothetical protein